MKGQMRPPTLRMIKKLKECDDKLKHRQEPFFAEEMKSSLPGLYKRGLIETKMEIVNEKKILCIYVTELGKKFLEGLNKN